MSEIKINIAAQTLTVFNNGGQLVNHYLISSARNGVGEVNGSYCTPRGRHFVRAKIGAGLPVNAVFVKRRHTGEVYSSKLGGRYPGRDWILTRILWLSGCEVGYNRLHNVDTMRRFIYIHGSPDSIEMGKPGSIGCIRMRNFDILELFGLVDIGTRTMIHES